MKHKVNIEIEETEIQKMLEDKIRAVTKNDLREQVNKEFEKLLASEISDKIQLFLSDDYYLRKSIKDMVHNKTEKALNQFAIDTYMTEIQSTIQDYVEGAIKRRLERTVAQMEDIAKQVIKNQYLKAMEDLMDEKLSKRLDYQFEEAVKEALAKIITKSQ